MKIERFLVLVRAGNNVPSGAARINLFNDRVRQPARGRGFKCGRGGTPGRVGGGAHI